MLCPICRRHASSFYKDVDSFSYYRCPSCKSIHIEPAILQSIDSGVAIRAYDSKYWDMELAAARERASGAALVRAGEAILYARRPVERFLDVGAGPGYLLDRLAQLFPDASNIFHAVEMFPPPVHSAHPNYRAGPVNSMAGTCFDVGVCIEVAEHLTPTMLSNMAQGLAEISKPNSLWLFNTGMPDYVTNEDEAYLDPTGRGHIVSYSIEGLRTIFGPAGFVISALPGKSFAFIAEYRPTGSPVSFDERIYSPLKQNRDLLQQSQLLYQAAFESARAYLYCNLYQQSLQQSSKRGTLLSRMRRLCQKDH